MKWKKQTHPVKENHKKDWELFKITHEFMKHRFDIGAGNFLASLSTFAHEKAQQRGWKNSRLVFSNRVKGFTLNKYYENDATFIFYNHYDALVDAEITPC